MPTTKSMRTRSTRGQNLVEYSIGIGAVTAVCMLCLCGLGGAAEDIVRQVLVNINDANDLAPDPTNGSSFGILSNGNSPQGSLAPWNPQ